jgi:hypothetical protein
MKARCREEEEALGKYAARTTTVFNVKVGDSLFRDGENHIPQTLVGIKSVTDVAAKRWTEMNHSDVKSVLTTQHKTGRPYT